MIQRSVVAALCAIVCVGCFSRPAEPTNVLILCIDALRADHVGAHGYRRDTTPTFDRLAKRGVLFTNNTSPSSYTRATVPSIFTGVFPSVHGVRKQGKTVQVLNDEFLTLAEILRDAGYATAAFMPNPSLRRAFGFDQGFEVYRDDVLEWRAETEDRYETADRIQRKALEWLDENEKRAFFLYLHYRDVHGPYLPPKPYDSLYWSAAESGESARILSSSEYKAIPKYLRLPGEHQSLEYYLSQYDAEIRYTDDKIAQFLSALEARGRLDDTLIVITSDHGEAFLEHGNWNHGNGVYQEEIHSPLLWVDPQGKSRGLRVASAVQTLDLFPTILERLGFAVPEQSQGKSLRPLLDGHAGADRPVYSESEASASVRIGAWKLIRDETKRAVQLFDLSADPGETRDRGPEEPEVLRRLAAELDAFQERNRQLRLSSESGRTLDEDTVDGLKALGYIQ